jgi:NAD(P)-dependent dehydrogenase (short-subunit alcohol dehydrogenase family)
MENMEGKVAFITGGASGIGLGIARAFAKYGMKVVIADIRQDALDSAMACFKKNRQRVHPIRLDVTDRAAYINAADEAESVFDKIHILINNAGVAISGPIQNMTFRDWDFAMNINVGGVINGLVTVLPRILKHGEGGHIVATSSTAGVFAVGGHSIYCTTKYAVAGMMECLATELSPMGIGASVLIPGPTTTNLGAFSAANRPSNLQHGKASSQLSSSPQSKNRLAQQTIVFNKLFMDPLETGERVVRGIKRNDLFIITHPEFKDGILARNQAILRAVPDQPPNKLLHELLKKMGSLVYNHIYESQMRVGPPDWTI